MTSRVVRFGEFTFDRDNRQLCRGETRIALNARYLDALALLVGEPGDLVTKQRFHDEVWRGVPVTDEALTQCIRTLRRELGDDAIRPRFIATVPKHGYRFIATVEAVESSYADPPATVPSGELSDRKQPGPARRALEVVASGTAGAVVAGLFGGAIYGAIAVARLPPEGGGAISTLLVFVCLTAAIALIGGFGVSAGIALAGFAAERPGVRFVIGGAAGGFVTGAAVRLIGLDAFDLLFGGAPRDFTGGSEGALLGASAAVAVWLASAGWSVRRAAACGALAGALAGIVTALLGGRLLGGSLASLAERFPASRLDLHGLGVLFGEPGFGLLTRAVTGAAEAALFVASAVAGIVWAQRRAMTTPTIPPPGP